jgi:hypothetical protein
MHQRVDFIERRVNILPAWIGHMQSLTVYSMFKCEPQVSFVAEKVDHYCTSLARFPLVQRQFHTAVSCAAFQSAIYNRVQADVAQLVEQPIRNRQVSGSSPLVGSRFHAVKQKRSRRWLVGSPDLLADHFSLRQTSDCLFGNPGLITFIGDGICAAVFALRASLSGQENHTGSIGFIKSNL